MPENLPVVQKAQPSGLNTLDENEPLYRESAVVRERLGWEGKVNQLKKERDELKTKISKLSDLALENKTTIYYLESMGWKPNTGERFFKRFRKNALKLYKELLGLSK